MGWWRQHVVPRMADRLLDSEDVHRLRARACEHLRGDVLELGCGSGLNTGHYPPSVRSVAAIEPSDVAWRMAGQRVAATSVPVTRAALDGQHLQITDDSMDGVLSTFTMCTIPDLDAALSELVRVLRPGGSVHFVEHGRSDDARVARWQARLQPVNARIAGGCHIDRPIADHLRRSGLQVERLESRYDKGPKPFGFLYVGWATKPVSGVR